MKEKGRPGIRVFLATMIWLAGCASSPGLPPWVSSVPSRPGYFRAVGFGQGDRIPEAVHSARRNALMQIVESSFGESVNYDYRRQDERTRLIRTSSVDDFFQSATSGSLFGQRVLHNEVVPARNGYVAYVLLEVSKKDLKKAYNKYIQKEKARKDLVRAEARGAVLLETHHYRQALRYYRALIRKSPESADVWWIGAGAALYRLGDYRRALDATDNGLLRNPRSFYGYWNRASILRRLGEKKAALDSLKMACRLRPSSACSMRLRKEKEALR